MARMISLENTTGSGGWRHVCVAGHNQHEACMRMAVQGRSVHAAMQQCTTRSKKRDLGNLSAQDGKRGLGEEIGGIRSAGEAERTLAPPDVPSLLLLFRPPSWSIVLSSRTPCFLKSNEAKNVQVAPATGTSAPRPLANSSTRTKNKLLGTHLLFQQPLNQVFRQRCWLTPRGFFFSNQIIMGENKILHVHLPRSLIGLSWGRSQNKTVRL